MHIGRGNNQISKPTDTKFLALTIDNILLWKMHVYWFMSKLGSVCYAVIAVEPYMSQET